MMENEQYTREESKIIGSQVDIINRQLKKNIEAKDKEIKELKKQIKEIREYTNKARMIEKNFLQALSSSDVK